MTTGTPVTPDQAIAQSIERLRAELEGRLIMPDDPEYESARIVMRGDVDDRPRAIARVANATDVARVIALARETGFELAVRSGGHSGAGHSTTDTGIVIDLRDMKGLEIDRASRTAWAETGLTAAEVTSAAWGEGLAVGFGDTGSVGIGGITLGGGVGYLGRKHGLTIDSLLAAELVTADGELLTVDDESHPDLFWAIRGGGGNFGVATRFKYRLHEVDGFVGGILVTPATADTIAGFIRAADEAPDELSTIANVMPCPPMPFVPEEHHGQLVILAMLGHAGDVAAGERAVAPFRALAAPLADLVKPMPYPEMYPPDDESYRPKAFDHTLFLDSVDRTAAQTIVDSLNASDASLRAVQLRVLGGAIARVPVDATAFAHRERNHFVAIINVWFDVTEERAPHEAWTEALWATIRPEGQGVYVNFLEQEGEERIQAAYPGATWDRLAAVKKRYDPTNLFRLNQNIPPA